MLDIDRSIELEGRYHDPILDAPEQRYSLTYEAIVVQDARQTCGATALQELVSIEQDQGEYVPKIDEDKLADFCSDVNIDSDGIETARQILLTQPHEQWFRLGGIEVPHVPDQKAQAARDYRLHIARKLMVYNLLVHNGMQRGGSKFMISSETVKSLGLMGEDYDPEACRGVAEDDVPKLVKERKSNAPRPVVDKKEKLLSRKKNRARSSEVVDYNQSSQESGPDTSNPIVAFIMDGQPCTDIDLTATNLRKALSQMAGDDIMADPELLTRFKQMQEVYAKVQRGLEVSAGALAVTAAREGKEKTNTVNDAKVVIDNGRRVRAKVADEHGRIATRLIYEAKLQAAIDELGLSDREAKLTESMLNQMPIFTWFTRLDLDFSDFEFVSPAAEQLAFSALSIKLRMAGFLDSNQTAEKRASKYFINPQFFEDHRLFVTQEMQRQPVSEVDRKLAELKQINQLCLDNKVASYIVFGGRLDSDDCQIGQLFQAYTEIANTKHIVMTEGMAENLQIVAQLIKDYIKTYGFTYDATVEANANLDPSKDGYELFANCLGVDPDLFFPERGESTKEAKGICKKCLVQEECLEYALSNGEKFGIWGGLSERERRRIRRQRSLARAAQQARQA